jgi:hypothetical protein
MATRMPVVLGGQLCTVVERWMRAYSVRGPAGPSPPAAGIMECFLLQKMQASVLAAAVASPVMLGFVCKHCWVLQLCCNVQV